MEDNFSMDQWAVCYVGEGEHVLGKWFPDGSSVLHLLYTLFLLLLYQICTSDHQALHLGGWGPLT